MPKVAVQADSTVRFNPYISKTISKSLLTPCRQVGLSRKRKTPNSANNSFDKGLMNNSLVESSNIDTTSINVKAVENDQQSNSNIENNNFETTPVTSKAEESKKKKDSKKKPTVCEKNSKVSKCLIVIDSDDSSDDIVPLSSLRTELNFESQSSKTEHVSSKRKNKTENKLDSGKVENQGECKNWPSYVNVERVKKEKKSPKKSNKTSEMKLEDEEKTEETQGVKLKKNINNFNDETVDKQVAYIDLNSPEIAYFKVIRTYSRKNPKIIAKETEIKTVYNLDEVNANNCKTTKEPIVLKDLTNGKTQTGNKSPKKNDMAFEDYLLQTCPIPATKTKKIKRSLSMKKSTSSDYGEKAYNSSEYDDVNNIKECLVSLNKIETSYKIEQESHKITETDLKNLMKQIKEKQMLVDELKQAEIYKKKHNVEELEKLTAIWKSGCISALEDLLPLIQQHEGNMDMAKLLNNLKVPKDMISLDPNGDLI